MAISDKYDKLRDRNHKPYEYQHYPKWVTDNDGKSIVVADEYEHEQLAPKDYSKDPYLAERREEQAESRENVLELVTKPAPKMKATNLKLDKEQKLEPAKEKTAGSTLLNTDTHS